MAINIINESFPVSSPICHLKSDFTTECDVIVPDSKPDIAKILQLSARVKTTSCETQSDRVIISGTVFFNILYLADNEEKSVKCIDASCAFSNLFQHSGIRENMLTFCDVDVSELSCNIANCRKLTVKAILGGSVRVFSNYEVELISEITGARTKESCIPSTHICSHVTEAVTITDSFELSQSKSAICEILKADARISDTDIKVIDNKAIIKGSLVITTLYQSNSGLDFVETEIPFAQVLDSDGIMPDMLINYDVRLSEIFVSSAPDSAGEIRCIDVNAELVFRVIAEKTTQIKCITDAYLPHGALDIKRSVVAVSGIEHTLSNEVNFKERITLPETIAPISTVYQLIARPICEKCEIIGEKLVVSGYTEVYILYLSNDENSPVYSYKQNIDFSVDSPSPGCSLSPTAQCKMRNINYVINDDRCLEVRGSVGLTTRCSRETETEVIFSAEEAPYTPEKRSSIIISFMSDGRSLWDIAKHYNIDEIDILIANAIENENEIKEGTALIIPK